MIIKIKNNYYNNYYFYIFIITIKSFLLNKHPTTFIIIIRFDGFDVMWAIRSLDLITIVSAIFCNAFFLSWSEQVWQICYLLVQVKIYVEHSYLGHIFQDID